MEERQERPIDGPAPGIRFFVQAITDFVDAAPHGVDERIRFQHFTVLLMLAIPTMVFFGVYNFVRADYILTALILLSGAGLVIGWFYLGRTRRGAVVYRTNSFLFGMLLLYLVAQGGDAGAKILWMYTLPLIALFLLGKKEGLLWTSGAFLLCGILLFVPLPLSAGALYPFGFKLRFAVTFSIVTVIAYWFEHLRETYHAGMLREHRMLEAEKALLQREIGERRKAEQENAVLIGRLQEALTKVKLLSGFLPICASCKRIRDEQGNWTQIESYIRERSEAEFSHGVCPECRDQAMDDLFRFPKRDAPAGGTQ